MNHGSFISTLTAIVLCCCGCVCAEAPAGTQETLRANCHRILLDALKDKSPWVHVHAAEALVRLKDPEPALKVFRPLADSSDPPYRIVVWRVLAAAEPERATQRKYIERIRRALMDPHGPDQTHAIEALAKLHEPMIGDAERRLVRQLADGGGPSSPFAVWRLGQDGDSSAVARLVKLLSSDDSVTRLRAAAVLAKFAPLPASAEAALSDALEKEKDPEVRPLMRMALGGASLRKLAQDTQVPPAGRYFAAARLAQVGTRADEPLLINLLDEPNADVRVAAAAAWLEIEARSQVTSPTTQPRILGAPRSLSPLQQ